MMRLYFTIFLILFFTLDKASSQSLNQLNDFEVIQSYWLDSPEFTEGLFYDNAYNRVFESTGLRGDSEVRTYQFNNENSEIENIHTLFLDDPSFFGEGLTRLGEQFYQLSYHNGQITVFHEENINQENDALVVDRIAAQPRNEDWRIPEGWGLTTDNTYLYMSDGSNRIYRFLPSDLIDFTPEYLSSDRTHDWPESEMFHSWFEIYDPITGEPLININELELVGNYIYANIWQTNLVVKIQINENSMQAIRFYDFTVLHEITCDRIAQRLGDDDCSTIDVLNGIAYDNHMNEFIITGKEWPVVFRITIGDNTAI